MAMVNAIGGHFASAVAASRLSGRLGNRVQVFPVEMPLAEMVAGLNRFRPIIVAYLMLTVVIFVIINLIVDLLYAAIDPRVRLAEAKG